MMRRATPLPPSSTPPAMPNRTVFFVSDGTGITAETFGNSILAQFAVKPRHVRRPFIDTRRQGASGGRRDQPDGRARRQAADRLHHAGRRRGARDRHRRRLPRAWCSTCSAPSSSRSRPSSASSRNHRVGRFSDAAQEPGIQRPHRGDQLLAGARRRPVAQNLAQADVILVGVSRSGKTPTSLYLAMQHGIKAANYPLIPEDFERGTAAVVAGSRTSASASA